MCSFAEDHSLSQQAEKMWPDRRYWEKYREQNDATRTRSPERAILNLSNITSSTHMCHFLSIVCSDNEFVPNLIK